MAALDPGARRRLLSGARARDHGGELDPRLGRPAARGAILRRVLSARLQDPMGRDPRRHLREPLDDGGFHRGRHRDLDPGRNRRGEEHGAGSGLLFLPRHPGGLAQLSGSDPRHLFRQAVRLRPVRGLRDARGGHRRLLRQAAGGRHRGHGTRPGRGDTRHRRKLAAVDQLRHPAAGDAAHHRARPLPLRYQLPRIRRGRHRGRRRHRGDAQYRLRPLRVRLGGRDPAGHHRHRDAGGIFVRRHSPLGAVMAVAGTQVWRRRDPLMQFAVWAAWLLGTAIFVYCWGEISDRTIWAFVTDAPTQAADLGARMVPPDWGFIKTLGRPLWDTLNMATLGTAMAIVIAVPVAYCAARNTTPSMTLVRPVALFVIVSSRSINSLIWALMLVTIVGPGVFAGILAIGLRSIGFCAKLLYEAIEEIDESQVEAVRATGASRAQVTAYGIVPQVMPAFAGISVFRWDINIRESTVLGLVGAGGIGLPLNGAITTLAWTRVSLILLVIVAAVVAGEWISAKVRHAII